ncbi:MAG: alcohol dehydrogenase catalytic domain-containing protein [Verrucomicrobiales bacterium]|nr:alcohol dehydrogenase catalytic domain-containing protein [Verrucomicrobiales bacterium]
MTDPLPDVMQALVYRGINDLRVESLPVPQIGSGELLVRVAACGVCPTDIKKIQYGTVPPPRIFGHETAGTIVRVGSRVRGFRIGERVALHHHVPCQQCHACRHGAFAQCETYKRTGISAGFEPAGGGFAEYVRVMSCVLPGVVRIPRRNSFIEGAMLEPVNTVLKAVRRLTLLKGDWVAVVGQGPIGLMFTRILTLKGMRVIANDLLDQRLRLAADLGARKLVQGPLGAHAGACRGWTRNNGLDAAIIVVPSDEAVDQAKDLVRGGGEILLFAHTLKGVLSSIDFASICMDEKALLGSYSSDFGLQAEAAKLVFSRNLDMRMLVTHTFSIKEGLEAIALAAKPAPDSLKIVIAPARDFVSKGVGNECAYTGRQ